MLRAFNLPFPCWESEEKDDVDHTDCLGDNMESPSNLIDLRAFHVDDPEMSSEEAISQQEQALLVILHC